VFVPLAYTKLPPEIKYLLKNGQEYSNPVPNVSTTSNSSSSINQAGSYQVVSNYSTDPNYIAALSAATTSYPFLNTATVIKVQEQVVAGMNFIINFQSNNSTDTY
jgi:hypothetical protein